MSISYDVTATLREQMKHHEPIVLVAAGFKGGAGAMAGGIGYAVETSPTLASADSGTNRTPLVLVYDARGNGGAERLPQSPAIIKTV